MAAPVVSSTDTTVSISPISAFVSSPALTHTSSRSDPNLSSLLRSYLPPLPSFMTSTPPSQTVAPFGGTLNQTCSIKLNRQNYLLWRYTTRPIVRGYKLDGHLFGTTPCPSEFLPPLNPSTSYTRILNPAFETWVATNQLLMEWLLGSMTEEALVEVIGCSTAYDIWKNLEVLFNNQVEARILELKDALTKTQKGNRSMADYLAQMKGYSDSLAAVGYLITSSELILATLGGLSKDFESVIVNITSRVGSLIWPEVQAQLLTHERLVARFNTPSVFESSSPSANMAAARGFSARPIFNGSLSQSNYGRGRGYNPGSRGGRYRGRGGRTSNNGYYNSQAGNYGSNANTRPQCQVCGKLGHTAVSCYHRFDANFSGTGPPANSNTNARQISAYFVTPEVVNDPSWYLDSGATNHVTSYLGNLHLKVEYNGNETLVVGNGQENRTGAAGGNP